MSLATREEVLEAIRQILADPPYSTPPPKEWLSFLDKIREWFANIFVEPIRALAESSPLIFSIVVGGLLLLLFAMLAHIGYTFYRFLHFKQTKGAGGPVEGMEGFEGKDLEKKALELAEQKNFSEAIRFLFLALLRFFNVEQPSRSKTPRECVGLIPAIRPEEGLYDFVRVFERSFFGREPVSEGEFEKGHKCYRHQIGYDEKYDEK